MKLIEDADLSPGVYAILAGALTGLLLVIAIFRLSRLRALARAPLIGSTLYTPVLLEELKRPEAGSDGSTLYPLERPEAGSDGRGWLGPVELVAALLLLWLRAAVLVWSLLPASGTALETQVADACWTASWLVAVAVLLVERKNGACAGRSLRLWWLLQLVLASGLLRGDLRAHPDDGAPQVFRALRVASYAPSLVLAVAGVLQEDTWRAPAEVPRSSVSPEIGASILNLVSFGWLNSLLVRGAHKPLKHEDLNEIRPDDSTRFNFARLEAEAEAADPVAPLSLFRLLRKSFGWEFLRMIPFKLVNDIVQYANPILIHQILHIIETGQRERLTEAYILASCMFLASETQSLASGQYFLRGFRLGLHTRCALNQLVYQKSLKLSNAARKKTGEGAVLSYMQIDSQKLCDSIPYLNMVWSAPLQFCICMVLLYRELEWSCFAGVAVLVALIPVNTKVARTQQKYTRATMQHRDKRVNLLLELLQAIRSIKQFAWETPSMQAIDKKRQEEMKQVKGNALWGAFGAFLWGGSPLLVTVATFLVYTLVMGRTLNATKAFTSMALFNLLRFPLSMIPGSINRIIDISVVVTRLSAFLNADEKRAYELPKDPVPLSQLAIGHYSSTQPGEHAVEIANSASFAWAAAPTEDPEAEATAEPFRLLEIELRVSTGALVGITGKVGCGKSSLLAAMANLMPVESGQVVLRGSVAFCAQQPWIQNATVKENILFGRAFDEARFHRVVEACALMDDLRALADHEETQIGERGVTLSGGQRARVALARACYVDADIYLMDDILSAVDSGVGEWIMERCVQGLLRDKTVLIATHHIQWLPVCDLVVHVDNGKIAAQGSWDQVESHIDETLGTSKIRREKAGDSETLGKTSEPADLLKQKKGTNVTAAKKEDSEEGLVKQHIWVGYAKALTARLLLFTLLIYALAAGLQVGSSVWLSNWSNHADKPGAQSSDYYVGVYSALATGAMLLIWARATTIAFATIAAGRRVHGEALSSVFHTPVKYFDENPLGRIINRFSQDLQVIDVQMRMTLQGMLLSLFNLLSTLGVALAATPFLGLLLVPLAYIYYTVARYYRHSSREVQRLTSTSLSPIYTAFAETLSGVDTITTFRDQPRFLSENSERMDYNLKPAFVGVVANRWLAVRLEFIGNVLVLGTAMLVVFEFHNGNINAGMAGLALSYVVTFTDYLNWLIRQFTSAETQMVAVERLDRLCSLEAEPDPDIALERWPAHAGALATLLSLNC